MVIEQLQHILDLEAEIDRMQDEDDGTEVIYEKGKITVIAPDDYRERAEKRMKREQELYEELYSSIGRDIRWWWD